MPIYRQSAARRRAVLAVALADVAGIAGLAAAQISPGIDDNPSAREKVEREGEAAMDRLKGAVSRRKAQQQNGPSDLPKPSEVERRRAFEAMRDRAKSPAMEARARDALETGKDRFAAQREAMAKRPGHAPGPEAPEPKAGPEAGPAPAAQSRGPVRASGS